MNRFDTILNRLNSTSDEIIDHILRDDNYNASISIDELRFIKSTLNDNFQRFLQEQNSNIKDREIRNFNKKISQFNKKDELIEAWCHRLDDQYNFDQLINFNWGIDYLLDTMLPSSWDFQRDLIFLHSKYATKLRVRLQERGQNNIILFKQDEKHEKGVLVANSFKDIAHIVDLMMPKPKVIAFLEPLDLISNKQELIDLRKKMIELLDFYKKNETTEVYVSAKWINNKAKNLPALVNCYSIMDFQEYFFQKTMILALPGPSLEENIETLIKYRDKFCLISAAQSCPALTRHGITPDYICVIDYQNFASTLQDVDHKKVQALILYDTCDNAFFATNFRKIVLKDDNNLFDTNKFISRHDFYHSGQSVGIMMLRLAIGLKAKAIGIVGLDCSLSNGEYSVYKGHSESETLENNPNAAMSRRDLDENDALVWHSVYARYFKKIHLKSNSGKRIYTIEPYFNTLRYIEDLLELQKPEIPIFNLSKNGAVISGAEYKTAKDFISKFQNEIIQNDYLDDVFINQSKRASIIKNDVKKLPKYLYELHNLSVKLLSILNNKKEYDLNKFHKKFIFLIKKHNVLIYLLRREVDYLAEDIRINTTAKVSDETLIFTFRRIAKITKELRNNLVKSLKNIDKL